MYASWGPEFVLDSGSGADEDTANHYFEFGFKVADDVVLYGEYALIGRDVFSPGAPPTNPTFPRKYDEQITFGLRWSF